MPELIADQRWTLDTIPQLAVAGPLTVTGTTTLTGNLAVSGTVTSTGGGGTVLRASTVAASAAINTTETNLLSAVIVPAVTLAVGSHVRITLEGTTTTTGANISTFTIRAGTAGTTADASVAAIATPVAGTTGTNIPFKVVIDFNVQTLGAAGTAFGSLTYVANAATGMVAAVTAVVPFTSSTLATTTATRLDITYVSAATTTTTTFQDVTIEIIP